MDDATETMSATRRIAASPAEVFATLVDPTTHAGVHGPRVDGTTRTSGRIGRVEGALDTEPLTRVGQRFRMAMYHEPSHASYETINEVLVREPSSAVGWRTGYLDDVGAAHFGGWLWRYDLVPADGTGTGTDVTLTYDWSGANQEARDDIDFPPFAQDHLDVSLSHLEDLVVAKND